MKIIFQNNLAIFLFIFFLMPYFAIAHQPRITENRITEVPSPEISKAYYGKLTGEPDIYIIKKDEPFDLYVNVLVPDIKGQKRDVSAVVLKDKTEIVVLDGINFEWKKFYEPFGVDTYWMGPEYKARVDSGIYEIRVWSSNNDSKYSLAIGEIEAFDFKESLNALSLIPKLKKDFFNESPIGFIKSPFGWGLIFVMYLFAGIFVIICNLFLKYFVKNTAILTQRKISKKYYILLIIIGFALLLLAILTTWNPILIFLSGLCIFCKKLYIF